LSTNPFDIVRTVGLALPDVEATTKYDGSPVQTFRPDSLEVSRA